ncbi:MAG: serine hydrolase [Candidatus Aminicenantes bacterium]|jgi:CubicO group peptidase (beta-lactamase class C family)
MKKTVIFCLALFLLFQFTLTPKRSFASENPPPLLLKKNLKAVISDLETRIPDLMEKAEIPGLQIALVRKGEVVWHKAFGVKNAESNTPVTDETIFEAASLTKPFFAYAVMMMVDEGLIDLDKPLHTFFTREETEKGLGHSLDAEGFKREWFEKATGRHILSHSGGFPHGERGEVFPLFFEPGTDWKYSADGYQLLQLVVEKLKGEKLDTIMQKYVLDPLGMEKSCMVWREAYEDTMANGHNVFSTPQTFRKRNQPTAAASLYTTAEEYARFVCAVMSGEGLKKETSKEMLTSFIDMKEDKSLGWSLGFGLQNDSNGAAFWQWGDYGIFRNYIIAYPKQKTAVVYLTNSFNGLSVCSDFVGRSIGGDALGNAHLNYRTYDSPFYTLVRGVRDGGPEAAQSLLPELRKKYPDDLPWDTVGWVARLFRDENMLPEAVAIFEFIFKENSTSGRAAYELARAYLLNGNLEKAKSHYLKAKEAEEDKVDQKNIDWDLEYLQAAQNPFPLEEAYMQKLAGDYGPRQIWIKDGKLFYFREGGTVGEPRPLLVLSRDTFFIKGLVGFYFKVEFDDKGNPVKLVGNYDDGRTDETKRTK